jgi:hypothetical protein
MSEYIEIETETTKDPHVLHFYTNLTLSAEGVESYNSPEEMEEGSPVAQALSYVDGLRHLRIEGNNMAVRRDPDVPWHLIVADVTAAIKDFFL